MNALILTPMAKNPTPLSEQLDFPSSFYPDHKNKLSADSVT